MDTNEVPREIFWLENAEHLDLIADPTRIEILEMLVAPASVAQLAGKMGVPRTRLYHHVNLLEVAGMIHVVSTRQAGLQKEKIFQIAARNFKPSREFMESALPREQAKAALLSIVTSTQADFIRSVESGEAPLEDPVEARRTHLSKRLLKLTPRDLHQFITDLEALLERYEAVSQQENIQSSDLLLVGVMSMVYPSSRTKP